MSGKRTDYISWDEYFMGVATLSGMRSKDPNTQVGACIVSEEHKILSMGYNGFPTGCSDDDFPWAREGEPLENKYFYTTHSELNAILNYRGGSGWFTTATSITGRRQPSRRGRCFLPQGWIYRNTNIPAGSSRSSCRKRAFGAARDGGSFLCQ